ncbi:MAG: hypothetical protein K2X27_27665, partial [Candidatus Obscuribacterales bacterium]|nr:hypothetical protein [Candidatus Obscuribacterales bacterium]
MTERAFHSLRYLTLAFICAISIQLGQISPSKADDSWKNTPGGNEFYGRPSGALTRQGIEREINKDYRAAISYFEAAYKSGENPPFACWHKALCHYNLGYRDKCKELLLFIIKNFPRSTTVNSTKSVLALYESGKLPDKLELPKDYIEKYGIATTAGSTAASGTFKSRISESQDTGKTLLYRVSESGHMLVKVYLNRQPITAI